jgi:predicted dehydrogenase
MADWQIDFEIFDPYLSDVFARGQTQGFPANKVKFVAAPSGKYDLAIVSVPHDLALKVCSETSKFAERLLVEKPAIYSINQVGEWQELGRESTIFVGYNYRFLPHVQKLSQILVANELGKIRRVEFFLGHGGSPQDRDSWKMDIDRVGGGALLDPGSHCLDLALMYFPNLLEMSKRKISTKGFWSNSFPEDEIAQFHNEEMYIEVHASLIQWRSTFSIEVHGEDGYARLGGRDRSYGDPTLLIGRRWGWLSKGCNQSETEVQFNFPNEDSIKNELLSVLGLASTFVNSPATIENAIRVIYLIESLQN